MLFTKSLGKKQNPLIVFLHGFLGSHEDFLEMASYLEKDFYLILVDLPGHGKSPLMNNPLQVLQLFLDTLPPFHLVGYSMGGRIAGACTNAVSLTLISAHTGLLTESEKEERRVQEATWSLLLKEKSLEEFLQLWYNQPLFAPLKKKKNVFEKLWKRRLKNDHYLAHHMLMECSLAKMEPCVFNKKTLGLYGKLDKKYEAIYTLLPQVVQVIGIEESGHMIPLENPKAAALAIYHFIKEISYDKPSL